MRTALERSAFSDHQAAARFNRIVRVATEALDVAVADYYGENSNAHGPGAVSIFL